MDKPETIRVLQTQLADEALVQWKKLGVNLELYDLSKYEISLVPFGILLTPLVVAEHNYVEAQKTLTKNTDQLFNNKE